MPAQRDLAYLEDIANAAKRIATYIDGMSIGDFVTNQMAQAAVIREIEIMGEAASLLSPEFKEAHPEVAWKRTTDLRNFYIHVYRAVNYSKVWKTAHRFIPRVHDAVIALSAVSSREDDPQTTDANSPGENH